MPDNARPVLLGGDAWSAQRRAHSSSTVCGEVRFAAGLCSCRSRPLRHRGATDGSVTSLPLDPDLPELNCTDFDPDLADHISVVLAAPGELIFRELAEISPTRSAG